ncbi:unnamed protein product [Vitrella brassicaformis CCMP3155]|uniref:Uncharacterized protein n=1 Tax=Vitrella brassicaformis (strain CCMP3155) TaxID=1169540 RepID=A0A0G4H800_VITBC|nr:unnamed protein product [Vitrella brassicaformis CCMP3155]|eukprot:CEM40003.1 unnamed protein product [Vitrella brassicaformis CCMP3155]
MLSSYLLLHPTLMVAFPRRQCVLPQGDDSHTKGKMAERLGEVERGRLTKTLSRNGTHSPLMAISEANCHTDAAKSATPITIHLGGRTGEEKSLVSAAMTCCQCVRR